MILIFRKYKNNGQPDDAVRPIEREAYSEDEKHDIIRELQAEGYEYEGVI